MCKAVHYFKLTRHTTNRVFVLNLFSITLLAVILAITQACDSSRTLDDSAKKKAVVALHTLIEELNSQRPADVSAYTTHLKSYLKANPAFYGAAIALLDENQNVIASPYVYRTSDGIKSLDLATPDYEIENQEWFSEPLSKDKGVWTSPYFDEGGGEVWMITYAVPVRDKTAIYAIATTDIRLDVPSE